ncbi:uncharacterized protein CCOS01_03297 [Colletotrichum costaricense]|uniref:Uncharacterized protein n=1 Tax=Colletotrichum costaricense TaxID=1209916 RepID=A0AAJ0E3Z9_9PEZI|nr:uncharacterized protein CCOS01_03297 [Colletotrichum costaricense]KAK1534545.1 hypothetical protein CCOS01_03297 [Colletotrichum costaricense]
MCLRRLPEERLMAMLRLGHGRCVRSGALDLRVGRGSTGDQESIRRASLGSLLALFTGIRLVTYKIE